MYVMYAPIMLMCSFTFCYLKLYLKKYYFTLCIMSATYWDGQAVGYFSENHSEIVCHIIIVAVTEDGPYLLELIPE